MAPVYNAKLGLYDMAVAEAAANRQEIPERPENYDQLFAPAQQQTTPVEMEPAAVPETPAEADKSAVVVESGNFGYTYHDVRLVPGEAFDAKDLPRAVGTYTIPSCAFSGTDNVYTYDSIEVVAYDEGQGEHLYCVYLTDPNITTDEGLCLGDSVDKMIQIYGENYTKTGSEYAYYRGDTILIVLAQGGVINAIEIRMAG